MNFELPILFDIISYRHSKNYVPLERNKEEKPTPGGIQTYDFWLQSVWLTTVQQPRPWPNLREMLC